MVVSEASGVQERPAPPGSGNGAVVPQEPAPATLNRESLSVNTIFKGTCFTLQA